MNKLKPGNSSASLLTTSVFQTIDGEDNEAGQLSEEDEEPTVVAFMGKSSGISFTVPLLVEENDGKVEVMEEDDALEISFSDKKKSSNKKNRSAISLMETGVENDSADVADQDQASLDLGVNQEEPDNDEDEIDKLQKELGGGPPVSTPTLFEEKMQVQPESKEAVEEGAVGFVAAKKKKRKKEKEKEKKTVAAVLEEDERLRKQEEELERLAEEKKHLKNEREKEKLLKKKQKEKLLTGKQKEEAQRLEARKQFLTIGRALPLSSLN
ncbi:hypothetical protein HAX54_001998 [Datura stramonium]|uniref:Uncharacterized protein n=1 Tax=Datura stramonium TaxID=4076 RepID=A0ABS8T5G8_DATST|nr:hypothetical protein [Datura stramonium]